MNKILITAETIAKNPTAYGVRTTSSLEMARKWVKEQPIFTFIILGDNAMYWVTPTTRIGNMLVKSGYEGI